MYKDKKVYFIEKRERLATGAPVMRSILRIPRRGGACKGQMSPKETTPLTPCRHLKKTEKRYAARDQSGSSSETSKWRREAQARLNPRVHPVTARTSRVPTARRTLRRFRVTRRPNRPDTPLALDSKGSPGAILRGTCPLYASFESPLYLFKCKDGEQKKGLPIGGGASLQTTSKCDSIACFLYRLATRSLKPNVTRSLSLSSGVSLIRRAVRSFLLRGVK